MLDRLFCSPQPTVAHLLALEMHFQVKDNLNFQFITGPHKISCLFVQEDGFHFTQPLLQPGIPHLGLVVVDPNGQGLLCADHDDQFPATGNRRIDQISL